MNIDPTWLPYIILGVFATGLGSFLTLAINGITLLKLLKNDPQKREVKLTESAVNKEDFEKHVAENTRVHDQIFTKIGGVERGGNERLKEAEDNLRAEYREEIAAVNATNEMRNTKLHERIDEVLKAVSRVEGKLERR